MANTFDVINTSNRQVGVSRPRVDYEEEARLVAQRREEARRRLEQEIFTKQYQEQIRKAEQARQRLLKENQRQNRPEYERMNETRRRINEQRNKPFWMTGNIMGKSLIQYGQQYFEGIPQPVATAAGWWAAPVHGAGYATKTLGSMAAKQQAAQLGGAGRFYRSTQLMNLGLSNLSAPGYLAAMTGQYLSSPRTAATTMIGKAITGGAGGLWTGVGATVLASIAASIMKSKKEQVIHGKMTTPIDVVRKYSQWRFFRPMVDQLSASGTLKPGETLILQLLGLIEQWTSPIPAFVSKELSKEEFKAKSAQAGVKELSRRENFFEKLLSKGEKGLQTFTYKYNPLAQLFTFLFTGKTPKEMLARIEDTYGEKLDSKKQERLGIAYTTFQLLHTPVQAILSQSRSYEAQMMSFTAAQFELLKGMTSELITIRRGGFAISDQDILRVQPYREPLYKIWLSMYEHIPILASSINIIKKLYQLSTKSLKDIKEAFIEKTQSFVDKIVGRFGSKFKSPEELLKELGLYKTTRQKAEEFIAEGLPDILGEIHKSGERRLDVLQDILDTLTGSGRRYEAQTKGLKWDVYAGSYLTPEEAEFEKRRRSKLIETTLQPKNLKEQIQYKLAQLFGKAGYETVSDVDKLRREAEIKGERSAAYEYVKNLKKQKEEQVKEAGKISGLEKLTRALATGGAGALGTSLIIGSMLGLTAAPGLSTIALGGLGLASVLSRKRTKTQVQREAEKEQELAFLSQKFGEEPIEVKPSIEQKKFYSFIEKGFKFILDQFPVLVATNKEIAEKEETSQQSNIQNITGKTPQLSTIGTEIKETEEKENKRLIQQGMKALISNLPAIAESSEETSKEIATLSKSKDKKSSGILGWLFEKVKDMASTVVSGIGSLFSGALGSLAGGAALGLGSMLTGVASKLGISGFVSAAALRTGGIYALIGGTIAYGVYRIFKDAIEGYDKEGIIGAIKGALGPSISGVGGTMGKYAAIGVTAGFAFGFPVGPIVGGLIGAGLGWVIDFLFRKDEKGESIAGKIWGWIKDKFTKLIKDSWARTGAVVGLVGGIPGSIVGGLIGYVLHKGYEFFFGDEATDEKKQEKAMETAVEKATGIKGGVTGFFKKVWEYLSMPLKVAWKKITGMIEWFKSKVKFWENKTTNEPVTENDKVYVEASKDQGRQSFLTASSIYVETQIDTLKNKTNEIYESVKKIVEESDKEKREYLKSVRDESVKIINNLEMKNEELMEKISELTEQIKKGVSTVVPVPTQTQTVGYARDTKNVDSKDVDIEDPIVRNVINNLFSLSITGLKEEIALFALGQPDMDIGV